MFPRYFLPALVCVFLVASIGSSADDRKAPEEPADLAVRLRLNAIETAKLLEHYEWLVKRETGLQDSVRACIKSGEPRLQQYQQALQETQDDLTTTKKKLVALETEKRKLTAQLGKKEAPDALAERLERTNQILARMLDHLISIEKRLEKMERQR